MAEPTINQDFKEKRNKILADRRLAVFYFDMVNRSEGLLTEARACKGENISTDEGDLSSGLGVAGSVASIGTSIVGGFISAASKVSGFFHKKEIKHSQGSTIDIAGDATNADWSKFSKELAAEITLQNQEFIREGVKLDPSKEPDARSAVKEEDRKKIAGRAKEAFGKIIKAINSDAIEVDPKLGIADEESMKDLVKQLSKSARTPTKQELAREAVNGVGHHIHEDLGPFTTRYNHDHPDNAHNSDDKAHTHDHSHAHHHPSNHSH